MREFTAPPTAASFGVGDSRGVALGDLDGDGDLDAVVANFGGQAETVWLNDGTGIFTARPTTPSFGAGDSRGVALGDLDGDGDLDAVVANEFDQAETVWVNQTANTPPTATNLTQSRPYLEDAASVALDDIVVSDADATGTLTATLTLAAPAAGALTTSGTATYTAATGVWTIAGSLPQVNAALAAVAFVPAADSAVTTTIATQVRDAAGTGPAAGTITLTGTPVNDDPTAGADSATVAEDSGANAITVLANDSGAPDAGETLTITAVTQGANGAVAITGGGTGLSYTPAPDFSGTDSFSYTIGDGNGGSATATVSITVTGVADAPTV
jgi:hypothetical protein